MKNTSSVSTGGLRTWALCMGWAGETEAVASPSWLLSLSACSFKSLLSCRFSVMPNAIWRPEVASSSDRPDSESHSIWIPGSLNLGYTFYSDNPSGTEWKGWNRERSTTWAEQEPVTAPVHRIVAVSQQHLQLEAHHTRAVLGRVPPPFPPPMCSWANVITLSASDVLSENDNHTALLTLWILEIMNTTPKT